MNHSESPQQDRDRVVEAILGLVRNDVRDLIYAGKDADAVGKLLAHTMGSMRALAPCLAVRGAVLTLSQDDLHEVEAVMTLIPEEVRPLFDAGILSGAHPLAYARRIQDMIAAATMEG
jgi:hypothetical protein